MQYLLFIVVMTVTSENKNKYIAFIDSINQAVLFCYFSTPTTLRLSF